MLPIGLPPRWPGAKEAAHTIALRMLHAAALGCLGVSSRL
jgi:hypothetical protein